MRAAPGVALVLAWGANRVMIRRPCTLRRRTFRPGTPTEFLTSLDPGRPSVRQEARVHRSWPAGLCSCWWCPVGRGTTLRPASRTWNVRMGRPLSVTRGRIAACLHQMRGRPPSQAGAVAQPERTPPRAPTSRSVLSTSPHRPPRPRPTPRRHPTGRLTPRGAVQRTWTAPAVTARPT